MKMSSAAIFLWRFKGKSKCSAISGRNTEKADWKSRSEYMLHSYFGKNPLQGSPAGSLVHIPL